REQVEATIAEGPRPGAFGLKVAVRADRLSHPVFSAFDHFPSDGFLADKQCLRRHLDVIKTRDVVAGLAVMLVAAPEMIGPELPEPGDDAGLVLGGPGAAVPQ